MSHGSKKAVLTAVASNFTVTIAKFIGFLFSGSSALLAEAVHSLADTANQVLLYVGLRRSERDADQHHQFGYGQERYFWNLVSAVTIFFVGCAYTIMHAMEQLIHDENPEISVIAFVIVGLAFVVEGYSFMVAFNVFREQSKAAGQTLQVYFSETRDPTTLAILIEDSVAMLGLCFALIGMLLAALTGLAVFDAIAAILIGLLMGFLSYYLAIVNRKYLLNTADEPLIEKAHSIWQHDNRIQNIQRINSIVLSPQESLLMADVELREETMFANMSRKEIAQGIRMMRRLDEIRRAMEADVRKASPQANHIFIEFGLPDKPAPDKPEAQVV